MVEGNNRDNLIARRVDVKSRVLSNSWCIQICIKRRRFIKNRTMLCNVNMCIFYRAHRQLSWVCSRGLLDIRQFFYNLLKSASSHLKILCHIFDCNFHNAMPTCEQLHHTYVYRLVLCMVFIHDNFIPWAKHMWQPSFYHWALSIEHSKSFMAERKTDLHVRVGFKYLLRRTLCCLSTTTLQHKAEIPY